MKYKDLSEKKKLKYGELCFNYLSKLAEDLIECEWDVDLDSKRTDVEIDIHLKWKYKSMGKANPDPCLCTYKTTVFGSVTFEDLPIDFEHTFKLEY